MDQVSEKGHCIGLTRPQVESAFEMAITLLSNFVKTKILRRAFR
jgi:hypothetical protein